MENPQKIIFFDGDCGFCNRTIQWILKHEKSKQIYFSSIQSVFTTRFFSENQLQQPDLTTFYYWQNGKIYAKSTAALKVSNELKWYWRWVKIGYVIPVQIRDFMYDFIAKRRNIFFKNSCFVPSKEQAQRFLLLN